LYAKVGAPPNGGGACFGYLAGRTTVWWTILGISVFTDFLFGEAGIADAWLSRELALRPSSVAAGRRILTEKNEKLKHIATRQLPNPKRQSLRGRKRGLIGSLGMSNALDEETASYRVLPQVHNPVAR